MNDRVVRIMEFLVNNDKAEVNILAELLDVSRVTLRKDLDKLEKSGIIKRHHGYASLEGADDTSKRIAFCYPIKRRIAKSAAQIVEDGETVMIESGSCCTLLAEELASMHKNITIITNSLFVANFIRNFRNIKIIMLGGYFQPESQVLVGSIVTKYARNFFIDKLFIGADGFIQDQGFTGRDYLRVETVMGLVRCVNKVYILTEAAKFKRRGAYNLIQFNKLTGVITNDDIPIEAESSMLKNNVKVLKVPSVDEKQKLYQFPGLPPINKEKERGTGNGY
ncbi:MAG: DeoR/GlpR family DNA-binding transcription regulator [Treponema sp.]|nr:DeoR/GlpR family DNA-binding transcription regulator [Treponema sp.]